MRQPGMESQCQGRRPNLEPPEEHEKPGLTAVCSPNTVQAPSKQDGLSMPAGPGAGILPAQGFLCRHVQEGRF